MNRRTRQGLSVPTIPIAAVRRLFLGGQGLLADPGRPAGREAFQKMGGLSKEAMENATKVLTADQKKAIDELKGEPFEIQFGPPRQ